MKNLEITLLYVEVEEGGGVILFASLWRISYENWYVINPLVLLSLQILVKSTKINFVEKSNKSEIMNMLHVQLCYYWDS